MSVFFKTIKKSERITKYFRELVQFSQKNLEWGAYLNNTLYEEFMCVLITTQQSHITCGWTWYKYIYIYSTNMKLIKKIVLFI